MGTLQRSSMLKNTNNKILKNTDCQSERCLPADEASAKISNAIQIQIVRQSDRWPVADDPSAKILYAQKENSYHLKPNPGHLINHIYVQYIFPGSFTCWWFHLKRSRELKEDFRKFTFTTGICRSEAAWLRPATFSLTRLIEKNYSTRVMRMSPVSLLLNCGFYLCECQICRRQAISSELNFKF